MKKSFIALTLTLLLLVSLFTVPAFAEKAPGCIHTACAEPECELICELTEHIHTEDCYAVDENGNQIYEEELICDIPEHEHVGTCYELDCKIATHGDSDHTEECYRKVCELEEHEHEGTCYEYLPICICQMEEHEHDNDCYNCGHVCGEACGVVPEQPANNGGTQFYPDYDENPAPAAPVESEAPAYVADEDASPKTGDPVSVSALVALTAAAAACVVFTARKVRG